MQDLLSVHGWWGEERSRTSEDSDVQVVYLPALLPREAQLSTDKNNDEIPLPYSFDAFGRSFNLQLVPNRRLVSSNFRVWSDQGPEPVTITDTSCHFLNAGSGAVAALSACKDHALHGLIVVDNSTYEVRPLRAGSRRSNKREGRTAHVIRRAPPPPPPLDDELLLRPRPRARTPRMSRAPPHNKLPSGYTIEIALFLDEAGYKLFHPFLNYNEASLKDMLLAYINGVQALYQHPSLGTRIQLSLVRLTLLRTQPQSLPAHAERGRLLDAFCAYQRSLNIEDDDDPQHWDMALLLSGMDFYSEEGGQRNGVTMGLAPVGGVCLPAHACVVSEFGTSDLMGRPYPSAGFTSVYILAHEIGHNLGMHHDGTGNTCARDGFIMSPSRGTNGEASWSFCSARVVADLQWATCLLDGGDDLDVSNELRHEKFGSAPGAVWGAKKQCEVLLRDVDAAPWSGAGAGAVGPCAQLACRSPHRVGFYYAGPALPGTPCGDHMWCQGGECVPASTSPNITEGPINSNEVVGGGEGAGSESAGADGWGPWRESSCQSGCTMRARGFRERRRTCAGAATCTGASYDVMLCDDSKVCGKKSRVSANELAARKCGEYARLLPELDARGGGLQVPHDPTRMWMGCAVFCRRAAGGGFYAPRVELNGAGLDPYFPDGTWCHHDGEQHYYCMQHHCLPENFKMTAEWNVWQLPSEDIDGPFNAKAQNTAEDDAANDAIQNYHSLNNEGIPIFRSAFPPLVPEEPESNWEVMDYVDLPRVIEDRQPH
ncbi:hypothetical protein evm_005962 [Chilo suppressalis]|nr:hypothetical protein evm_005962 [Chilo suppressalis]